VAKQSSEMDLKGKIAILSSATQSGKGLAAQGFA
jgi:hypothetical protein